MPRQSVKRGIWLLLVALVLFTGVPWYWPSDSALDGWLVPNWVWVSLAASWLFAGLVVWGALGAWPDEDRD